jgi:hypothetical protein
MPARRSGAKKGGNGEAESKWMLSGVVITIIRDKSYLFT